MQRIHLAPNIRRLGARIVQTRLLNSTTSFSLSYWIRSIHTTQPTLQPTKKQPTSFSNHESNGFPHKTLDQGHVLDTHTFSPDPHAAAARSGFHARHTLGFEHPHDAASPRRGTKFKMTPEEKETCGNREGVGFVDQVGGQSAAVEVFETRRVTVTSAAVKTSDGQGSGKP